MSYPRKELTPEQLSADFTVSSLDNIEVGDYVAYKTKARTWKNKDGEEIEYKSKINQGYVSMKPDPERQTQFKDTGYIWGFRGAHGGGWKQNEKFIDKVWKANQEAIEAHRAKTRTRLEGARTKRKEIAEEDAAQFDIAKQSAKALEKNPEKLQQIALDLKRARIKRVSKAKD